MEENKNMGVNLRKENAPNVEQNIPTAEPVVTSDDQPTAAPQQPVVNNVPNTGFNQPNMGQQNVGYNPVNNAPNMPQNNMGYNPMLNNQPKKDQGMAIASMVLGICSLVLGCCLWFLALPCAIVGVCLGAVSLQKKKDGRGMAIAGLVTSCICIAFLFIALIYISVAGTSLADMFKNYNVSQL